MLRLLALWGTRIAVAVMLAVMGGAALAQSARLTNAQPVEPRPDAPVAVAVDWQAVREDVQQRQRVRFTAVRAAPAPVMAGNITADEAVISEVPVLTPTQQALGFDAPVEGRLFPRVDFYTLVIEGDGILIEVFGTRLAHARPPDPLTARHLRGTGEEGYRSTPTAYGREITFNRYNAAYSITLECASPQTDPRCAEPGYGDRLRNSLQLMPGARTGEAE